MDEFLRRARLSENQSEDRYLRVGSGISARARASIRVRVRLDPETAAEQSALPQTYLFKTREGSRGILEIVELPKESEGVRIRYRLVEG